MVQRAYFLSLLGHVEYRMIDISQSMRAPFRLDMLERLSVFASNGIERKKTIDM